jgi:hypothetical protein
MKGKGCIYNLPILIIFLIFALFIGFSTFILPQETYAAVTARDQWTNIYSGAPGNSSGTITTSTLHVSTDGSNRLFLAAVCLELDGNWMLYTMNVKLGETALTTIGSTVSSFTAEHCYVGYLKESQIPTVDSALSVEYSTYTSYHITGIHVKWASYSDVNQTYPINDFNANYSYITTPPVSVTFGGSTTIDYIAEGLTLYVAANGGASATMTPPSGFSQVGSSTTTDGHSSFIAATANHGSNGNYASTTTVNFGGTTSDRSAIVVAALNPLATVVGNGSDPGFVTACPTPTGGATFMDAFNLQTAVGDDDEVTGVKVTLTPTNIYQRLSRVEITSDEDVDPTVFGYVDSPGSDTVTISLDTPIQVDETLTQYRVRITPKSHTDPDLPPGQYTVQGTVTGITSNNPAIYRDSGSGWVTIDNTPPGKPTFNNSYPGDGEIVLNWSNPLGSSEFVLVRDTTEITATPVDGQQYDTETNNTIGGTTVVIYVGSDLTFTDTELINGTNYYYMIFAKDSCGNYSAGGTPPSPYYYTPTPVVTPSSSGTQVTGMNAPSTGNYIGAAFTFQQSSGPEEPDTYITDLTITETGDAIAHTELSNVKVYYESVADLANCVYDGSFGETLISDTVNFDTSEKLVLDSVSIPVSVSPNYTCVYVVFDVDQSALNGTKIELEITSSDDFTLSGSAIKDGTVSYSVALNGTTTIGSPTTNLVKVGSFKSGTAIYSSTYVTDVGFQPKAVIFFWTRQDLTGFSSVMSIGEGFATAGSPIVNRSVAGICFDDANPTACGRIRSESYSIMFLKDSGGYLSGQGQVISFNPNGFTIYWYNAPGIDTTVNYIAFGGDDNFDAHAGTITAPMTLSSPYNVQYTGVGFKPDFVMFLASSNASVNNDLNTPANHMFFNTGFMTPTGQAAVSVRGRNGQTSTGHSKSQQSTNNAIMGLLLNGNQDWLASYVTMGDDGFTLNFSDRPEADTQIFYLALKGGAYKVGSFNQPTWCVPSAAPPCTQPFTSDNTTVGFKPAGLFMASVNRSSPSSIAPEGEISIGAASKSTDVSTERGTIWGETRDIIPPSDANMSVLTDKVIRFATGIGTGTPTINAEADFSDFLSNGFRLNWTTVNDNTPRQIVYWAIGNTVTTVGNGSDPFTIKTICPGGGADIMDAFTLQTSTGNDTVTDVTLSLPSGLSTVLSKIEIVDDLLSNVYGHLDNPESYAVPKPGDPTKEIVTISLDSPYITATTAQIQYKVRGTPKTHAAMPFPGSTFSFKGTVSAITSVNTKTYNDTTGSWNMTIDNLPPSDPPSFSGTPGGEQMSLQWTNPTFDFSEVVILRNTTTISDRPDEGGIYSQGSMIGSSTVRYVGVDGNPPLPPDFTDTELIGGETYYYKIFARDSCRNYSTPGVATVPYPSVTASSSGAQVGTMEAGHANQYIGAAFTFQQSSGAAGNITALTISETGSAVTNTDIKNVKVFYENNVSSCASSAAGNQVSASFNGSEQIVLGSSIPLSVYPDFTCVHVVFDVDLSVEDGRTVDLEITSSNDFTLSSGLIKFLSTYPSPLVLPDTTILIDTTPPGEVPWLNETPGDSQITFTWGIPSDTDFKGVRIMRSEDAIPPEHCLSGPGVTWLADVGIILPTYPDSGLVNGRTYYYRFCTYDEIPNYSVGSTVIETPPQVPILSYPAAPYNDGKDPDTGDTTTDFTFKVIYTDFEGDQPDFASGYPKIYIGDSDGMYGYTMSPDTSIPENEPLRDNDYTNGEQYVYGPISLGAAQDLRFYFAAGAASGNPTIARLPILYNTGPSVYLLPYYNIVGVPKDLGPIAPYSSVLGDDSGYLYCVFWDSTGLDTKNESGESVLWSGSWKTCTSGILNNIENGKGYYIWSMGPGTYRLDEPSGVINVEDSPVDIALDPDGGWTMISNPYNVNVKLEDVKVERDGTEYSFIDAVSEPNEWIDNSIYEYEGSVTKYSFKAFNESPPAILVPWVGYFIYVKDTSTPITLRIYMPVQ